MRSFLKWIFRTVDWRSKWTKKTVEKLLLKWTNWLWAVQLGARKGRGQAMLPMQGFGRQPGNRRTTQHLDQQIPVRRVRPRPYRRRAGRAPGWPMTGRPEVGPYRPAAPCKRQGFHLPPHCCAIGIICDGDIVSQSRDHFRCWDNRFQGAGPSRSVVARARKASPRAP